MRSLGKCLWTHQQCSRQRASGRLFLTYRYRIPRAASQESGHSACPTAYVDDGAGNKHVLKWLCIMYLTLWLGCTCCNQHFDCLLCICSHVAASKSQQYMLRQRCVLHTAADCPAQSVAVTILPAMAPSLAATQQLQHVCNCQC